MGDHASLSSLQKDLGIPINFQEESGLVTRRGVCVMGFLELWQEPGVYSRVTAGMVIQNSTLFSEVRNPV